MNSKIKTILLVEDEALIALDEKMSLEKYGYAVTIAHSGEEAIEMFKKNDSIDLVLMDVDLGEGIDGTMAARSILDERYIPIVFLSSHEEPEVVQKTEEITSYGYVVKSSSMTVLDASIKMAFKLFKSFRSEKEKDEALRESGEDYRKLFEDHTAVKLLIDPDTGNIFDANNSAVNFYGWSREVLRTMNIRQINTLAPDEINVNLGKIKKDEQTHFEFKHKRADGSIRDVDVYANKVTMAGRHYLHSIIHDITERKRVESALAELQALQNAIVDSTRDMIWSVDPVSFGLQTFNRSLSEYFLGRAITIKNGDRPEELFPPGEYVEKWRAMYKRALGDGPYATEYLVYSKNRILELNFNLLKQNGSVFGISVFGRDITERKRAEEALLETNSRFRSFVEQAPVAIGVWNLDGTCVFANQKYFEMLGLQCVEEMIGRPAVDFFAPQFRDESRERIRRRQMGLPVPSEYESVALRADGSEFPVHLAIAPIQLPDGTVSISFMKDITERKRTEDALKIRNEELSRMNEELVTMNEEFEAVNEELIASNQELMKAEESLRRSERKLDTMMQAMVDGTVTVNLDGQITYANQAAEKILGIGKDILGKYFQSREWRQLDGRGEPYPQDQLPLAIVLREKRAVSNVEHQVEARDGERKWLSVNAAPLLDDEGRLFGGIASFRDITGQKMDGERLVRMIERLSVATRAARLGIWDWDIGKNELVWDDRMYELYGVRKGDFAGAYEAWLAGVHPDDRALCDEVSLQARRGEREYDTEFRIVWPDGTVRLLKAFGQVVRDESGKPVRMTGINFDITEHRRSEEALRESEKRYALTLDAVNDGLWDWDVPSGSAFFSTNYYALLGYDNGEYPASYAAWRLLVHPDDLGRVEEQLRLSVESGKGFSIDLRMKMKSGAWLWVVTRGRVVERDAGGKAVRMVGTLSDITELKRTGEKVRDLLADKELLLKEVHHRIKNYMGTMMSMLSLQANALKEPSAAQALRDARNRMQGMSVLYDKLYRSENPHQVSLAYYLPALVDEIAGIFSTCSKVKVVTRIDDFIIDAKMLSPLGIIVNELITNAMKYAFPGRDDGVLTVSLLRNDGRATLVVGDNGVGIPESIDAGRSTGFGLMLVDMLVKQLRGTIRIERGGGSRFILEFDV